MSREGVFFVLKLKEIRLEKRVSQQSLAEFLHVHQATVSMYERETRKLTQDLIVKICLFLDTTPNELLDFNNAYEKYADGLIRMRSEYEKEDVY
jgi:transcriptional regulator with XRE-family HTH domain